VREYGFQFVELGLRVVVSFESGDMFKLGDDRMERAILVMR
jgi:hypothetical protein